MSVLTKNIEVLEKETGLISAPCAVDIIYKGALCKFNAAGALAPCATEASVVFAGVAVEKVDNSGDLDKVSRIRTKGVLTPEESIDPNEFFDRFAIHCGANSADEVRLKRIVDI